MKSKAVWLVLSCLVVTALVLVACGPAAVEEEEVVPGEEEVVPVEEEEGEEEEVTPELEVPRYGGVATVVLGADILGFDEAYRHHYQLYTIHLTHEELLQGDWTRGPSGTGETDWILDSMNRMEHKAGSLAESWEMPERGKMVFHIRKGVYWHDKPPVNGRELTAEDIVFSLQRVCSEPRSYIKTNYPTLAATSTFTAPDKWTVVIESPPEEYANAVTLFPDFVSVVAPEAVEQFGADINNWENAIGTGAFLLTDFISNSSATLTRNPSYWGKNPMGPGKGNQLPYLDGIKILIISDVSTRLAAIRTGKVDRTSLVPYEDAMPIIEGNPELSWKQYIPDGCLPIYMRTDKADSPFSDIKVRQALMLATDQPKIRDEYFLGEAEILVWPIIYTKEYANAYVPLEELPQNVRELYECHPDKARQLLADAGYPDGFKTSIVCYNTPTTVDYLSQIKDMWAEVGVELELDAKDWAVYMGRTVTRSYGELLFGYTSGIGTYFKMINFRGPSMFNGSYVDDANVAEVYEAMQPYVGVDEAKIDQMHAELIPYVLEQAWVIPGINARNYILWWPWVKNYHGELYVGYYNTFSYLKYVWMDVELKKALTGGG